MGTCWQRAGGPGRGSTSLAPRGRAMERGSHARGHAGNATRWRERAMHGWHPSSGTARKPSSKPARAVQHPSKAMGRSGPGPAVGLGCPGAVPAPPDSPAVPCLSFPSSLWARSHHPRPSRGVLGTGFMRLAVAGQGGCPPGCTFGLNPGVPLCTDTSKNNRPERSANRRLFIALHP